LVSDILYYIENSNRLVESMFSIFKQKTKSISINNTDSFISNPKETLLKSALRNGINFPYSCKVGGCAACKCQLISGKVKELTDASYILSAKELKENYILACQSVPKTDVTIRVDLSTAVCRQITGDVISQNKLTHDITQLDIRLEEPIRFTAGQYARLTVKALPDISRPYSFASKPQKDPLLIRFFIREVIDGKLSTFVNENDLVNTQVTIEGPLGDFYLRDSVPDSTPPPLLFIAGGSGLAPVIALLQEALIRGANRPVTLLFGARSQADIYYLEEIKEIAAQWKASFVFSQILSDEPESSDWKGRRGWVGDEIKRLSKVDWHVYLCGPPAMIDQSIEELTSIGIPEADIFADRFISEHQTLIK